MLNKVSKVLVTGAAGFIGSHLTERIHSLGLEVLGLDDFSNGYIENLSSLKKSKRFKLVQGDVLSPKDLSKTSNNVDLIFHFAAQSSVPKSTEDPLRDFKVNVQGTLNVLECARNADIEAVIFASSSAVYGNATLPTPEDHSPQPISNYGASKAAAEVYCSSYSALYGLKTASLRYSNIYGPRSRKGVMFDLLRKLQKNSEKLEVLGTGGQTRDYLYIDDAIDATLLVTEKEKLSGETFNVGSGESYSVREIVNKLLEITELREKTKPFYTNSSWEGDVQKTKANVSKLRMMGFTPKVEIDEGMRRFVRWYESEYGKIHRDLRCNQKFKK